MRMENYKELFLATLHNFTIGIRSAYPTDTDRQLYHRLLDAVDTTGHKIFKKRNDGRYLIADLDIGGMVTRVMTLFPNTETGKLDIDLTLPNWVDPEMSENIYMMLFKIIVIGTALCTNAAMSGMQMGDTELAKAIKARTQG